MTAGHADAYRFSPVIVDAGREPFRRLLTSLDSIEEDPTAFLNSRDDMYRSESNDAQEYATRVLDVALASGILNECGEALIDISVCRREIGIFDEGLLRDASLATVKALASTIRPLQVLAAYDLHPDLFVMVMPGLAIMRLWPEEWAERFESNLRPTLQRIGKVLDGFSERMEGRVTAFEEGEANEPQTDDAEQDDKSEDDAPLTRHEYLQIRRESLINCSLNRFDKAGAEKVSEALLYFHKHRRDGGSLLGEVVYMATDALVSVHADLAELMDKYRESAPAVPDPVGDSLRSGQLLTNEGLQLLSVA